MRCVYVLFCSILLRYISQQWHFHWIEFDLSWYFSDGFSFYARPDCFARRVSYFFFLTTVGLCLPVGVRECVCDCVCVCVCLSVFVWIDDYVLERIIKLIKNVSTGKKLLIANNNNEQKKKPLIATKWLRITENKRKFKDKKMLK